MYGDLKKKEFRDLKGEIGEVIAKHHLPGTISTRQNKGFILKRYKLNLEQLNFLQGNWDTFDLIDPISLVIYEVKTRNFFYRNLFGAKNKAVVTAHFVSICGQARILGFSVKCVVITLYTNWRYGFIVKDFNKEDFWVCEHKTSGWSAWLKKKEKARLPQGDK